MEDGGGLVMADAGEGFDECADRGPLLGSGPGPVEVVEEFGVAAQRLAGVAGAGGARDGGDAGDGGEVAVSDGAADVLGALEEGERLGWFGVDAQLAGDVVAEGASMVGFTAVEASLVAAVSSAWASSSWPR